MNHRVLLIMRKSSNSMTFLSKFNFVRFTKQYRPLFRVCSWWTPLEEWRDVYSLASQGRLCLDGVTMTMRKHSLASDRTV